MMKWLVVVIDFIILNALIIVFKGFDKVMIRWSIDQYHVFLLQTNLSLVLAEYKYGTVIHKTLVDSFDVFKRVLLLCSSHAFLSYVIVRMFDFYGPVGRIFYILSPVFLLCILSARYFERYILRLYRDRGGNKRYVTFIGSDRELLNIYHSLSKDATRAYNLLGYYSNQDSLEMEKSGLAYINTLDFFLNHLDSKNELKLGDEIYVCLSRLKKDVINNISRFCDLNLIRFYFVPLSVESIGLNMKREMVDDIEVYTTYESPLNNVFNRLLKRALDIFISMFALILLFPFIPIIALIIKRQSPGPLFYKQARTGYEGRTFNCYKFRSLHANHKADNTQVSKNDPRVFPFGHFMRKMSIDELPQFWNVLKGDMSVVGPRPHMLFHTDKYREIISRYMVRHFVNPGITGWAQVNGFRGETKELWQMEERVKRDIWYTEHWSFWLDMKIIWMTISQFLRGDDKAF